MNGLLSLHKIVRNVMHHKDICSSFGIVVDFDVDRTTSTSGNLEFPSMTTNRYSPVGNGPHSNQCEEYATELVVVVSFEGGLGVSPDCSLDTADISRSFPLPIGQYLEPHLFP